MLSLRDDQIEKIVKRMPDENGMTEADILRALISRGLRTSEPYRRDAIINAKIDAMMRSFAVDMTVLDNTVGEYLEEVETAESLNPLYPDTDIEELSGTQVDGVFPIHSREPPSRLPEDPQPARLPHSSDKGLRPDPRTHPRLDVDLSSSCARASDRL